MDTINQPVQSKAGKLSWSNMALKRCTSIEHLWNRKLVSLTSPMCSEIFLTRSHRSWRADVLSTPSVSMAIGSKIYWPSRSAYFSSLREAAISAAAPDSRAAALIYESASGHVTVTSLHNAYYHYYYYCCYCCCCCCCCRCYGYYYYLHKTILT